MRIVQKYGGSSLASLTHIKKVAKTIKARVRKGYEVVVVASAMGKTTNSLLQYAKDLKGNNKRELAQLLATGEAQSISLLALRLSKLGVKCISLLGWQAGIYTTPNNMVAFIEKIDKEIIENYLQQGYTVLVAGFQGINSSGDITTLGRGGSDTTAVALASVLECPCEIYTDVNGVYSVDPKLFPSAKKIKHISYLEMSEMAANGAKVLETRSVELAEKFNIDLRIAKTGENATTGTLVGGKDYFEKIKIKNISLRNDLVCVTVMVNKGNQILSLFEAAEKCGACYNLVSQIEFNNKYIYSFCLENSQKENVLKELKNKLTKKDKIIEEKPIKKISIVGNGLATHPNIAKNIITILSNLNIEIRNLSISELSICFCVEKNEKQAIEMLANYFNL